MKNNSEFRLREDLSIRDAPISAPSTSIRDEGASQMEIRPTVLVARPTGNPQQKMHVVKDALTFVRIIPQKRFKRVVWDKGGIPEVRGGANR